MFQSLKRWKIYFVPKFFLLLCLYYGTIGLVDWIKKNNIDFCCHQLFVILIHICRMMQCKMVSKNFLKFDIKWTILQELDKACQGNVFQINFKPWKSCTQRSSFTFSLCYSSLLIQAIFTGPSSGQELAWEGERMEREMGNGPCIKEEERLINNSEVVA